MISQLSAHFRQKWTHGAGRRRTPKISRLAGQDFGPADMGGGGGGPAQNFGRGTGWRRDLSALGPFGAEANLEIEVVDMCYWDVKFEYLLVIVLV